MTKQLWALILVIIVNTLSIKPKSLAMKRCEVFKNTQAIKEETRARTKQPRSFKYLCGEFFAITHHSIELSLKQKLA